MTRSLLVTCTAANCSAQATVQMHTTTATVLPPGWLVVASNYEAGRGLEFCSHACISRWALAMQSAHERQRQPVNPALKARVITQESPLEKALMEIPV